VTRRTSAASSTRSSSSPGSRRTATATGCSSASTAQEALDVAGWSLLTAQKTLLEGLTERVSLPLRLKLLEAAAAGAQVEKLVNEARAVAGVMPPP
jgi:hypothetical protein